MLPPTLPSKTMPLIGQEVWLFKKIGLTIYSWQGNIYQQQTISRYFPEMDLPKLISHVLQVASERR